MRTRRLITAALPAALLMLGAAGCSDAEDDLGTAPEPTDSPTDTTSPTETTGGPPLGWEDEFTREQLNTYNAALSRWERYKRLTKPIYMAGEDTSEARETFQEHSALWQRAVVELAETYDKGGLRLAEDVKPLWAYAKSIKPTYVEIIQCTDYRPLRYTRNGKPLEIKKPKHLVTPLIIKMDKPEGEWLYAGVTLKDKTSCAE